MCLPRFLPATLLAEEFNKKTGFVPGASYAQLFPEAGAGTAPARNRRESLLSMLSPVSPEEATRSIEEARAAAIGDAEREVEAYFSASQEPMVILVGNASTYVDPLQLWQAK